MHEGGKAVGLEGTEKCDRCCWRQVNAVENGERASERLVCQLAVDLLAAKEEAHVVLVRGIWEEALRGDVTVDENTDFGRRIEDMACVVRAAQAAQKLFVPNL